MYGWDTTLPRCDTDKTLMRLLLSCSKGIIWVQLYCFLTILLAMHTRWFSNYRKTLFIIFVV